MQYVGGFWWSLPSLYKYLLWIAKGIKLNTSNHVTDLIGPKFKCAIESPTKNKRKNQKRNSHDYIYWLVWSKSASSALKIR